MTAIDEILELPRKEKLKVMDLLWADLTRSTDDVESPSWHADVLDATAKRVADDSESPIDFSIAKDILRNERP